MTNISALILSILLCLSAGLIGSSITAENIPTWYATLNKPIFTPPNWLFAPVWTSLYILMGIAAYLIWRKGFENREVKIALGIFFIQLVLNAIWTPLFFGLHWLLFAFIEIVILWLFILWTIIRFYKISSVAALLLIPYFLWVSFASILNFSFWLLNK